MADLMISVSRIAFRFEHGTDFLRRIMGKLLVEVFFNRRYIAIYLWITTSSSPNSSKISSYVSDLIDEFLFVTLIFDIFIFNLFNNLNFAFELFQKLSRQFPIKLVVNFLVFIATQTIIARRVTVAIFHIA